MTAHLIVQVRNEVHMVSLGLEPVTVGREKDNAVRLDDRTSSRYHCRIEPHRGGHQLVDLGSQNGTVVNGKRIGKKVLGNGDRIEVGAAILYYRAEEEKPPAKEKEQKDRPARGRRGKARPRSPYATDPRRKMDRILARVFEEDGVDGLLELRSYMEGYVEDRSSALSGRGTTRENLNRLQEITKAISSEQHRGKLLTLIVDSVIELTKAERGFLLLVSGKKLEVKTARNLDREPIRKPGEKVSHSIAEEVARTGEPMITINAQTDERLTRSGSVTDLKLRSVMAVPLRGKGQVVGVLYVDNRFEEGVFTRVDLPLAEAFADQAAIAVENARLRAENERRREELERAKEKVEELNRILTEKVKRQSAELLEVKQILRERQDEFEFKYSYDHIVGDSPKMREVFRLLDKVTDSEVPVLIQGESGTGKELVARALHFNGPRKDGPFVSESCAAIPDTLLESELFGYKKGAFTGADRDRRGLLALASGGTLLLDEIGDMSVEMQGKLLRALEEREIRPLGGKEPVKVDVRIICASNKDLRVLKDGGGFREDLFYRLAVITILLPPLRDRREDVPQLVRHFVEQHAGEKKQPVKEVSDDTISLLAGFDWPGNVRQLRNEVQRAIALADRVIVPEILSDEIRLGSVPRLLAESLVDRSLKEITRDVVQTVERQVVREALEQVDWKKSDAARRLGISRPTLDSKINLYGLRRPQ